MQASLDLGRLTSADFVSKFLDQIEGYDTAARALISVALPMASYMRPILISDKGCDDAPVWHTPSAVSSSLLCLQYILCYGKDEWKDE